MGNQNQLVRSKLGAVLLAAIVVFSVVGIGAVHLPVLLVCASMAGIAATVSLRPTAERRMELREALPVIIALGLSAYTLLQAVPMPMAVLEKLSASSADIWKRSLVAGGEAELRWGSLSLDP